MLLKQFFNLKSKKILFQDISASTFLLLLITADCIFFFLHFLNLSPLLENPLFSMSRDQSYSEFYQYIKEFWIFFMLIILFIKTREGGYGVWGLVFLYILFDDSLRIHETLGGYLSIKWELPTLGVLRVRDLGEFIVSTMAGIYFGALLIFFYVRGTRVYKQFSKILLILILLLAFWGMFFDIFNVSLELGLLVGRLLRALEEGGEMIVMDFIVWYIFLVIVSNMGFIKSRTHYLQCCNKTFYCSIIFLKRLLV